VRNRYEAGLFLGGFGGFFHQGLRYRFSRNSPFDGRIGHLGSYFGGEREQLALCDGDGGLHSAFVDGPGYQRIKDPRCVVEAGLVSSGGLFSDYGAARSWYNTVSSITGGGVRVLRF
jgi:hypothetical protein